MARNLYHILGAPALQKAAARRAAQYHLGLKQGVTQACLLLQRASMKLCPVDTGDLKRSAGYKVEDNGPGKISGRVFYTQEYAIYVHENVGANFRVGQAKFLEQPARELQPEFKVIIRNAVAKRRFG
jgi:hypothetical protein